MTAPAVSVVVPTWNRADRLARLLPALEALAATDDVEVVVVDDGSTDGTAGVLAGAEHVTAVHQANGGAASARNAGWRRATAPVVAFLDDDCTPGPGWPLDLVAPFADPAVGGVGGRIVGAGSSAVDRFVEVERLVDHGKDLDGPDAGVDYLVTANAAYRRDLLEAVGGFDEAFGGAAGEDVDLSWRIRATGARLVRSSVPVGHDHRTDLGQVLRTYRGHGRARARLDARFPDRSAGGAAGRALSPRTWADRFAGYRSAGVGLLPSIGLLALRAAGLAAFWWGLRQGRRAIAATAA